VFNRIRARPLIRGGRTDDMNSMENKMKRLTLTLIAGSVLAALLGGCVVVPAPGYYYGGGGYYHGYYR
jgi:hypothetical protein